MLFRSLARLDVLRGFGRRSPKRIYCQWHRRAVKMYVGVMMRMTTEEAMDARCRVDSVHLLIDDLTVTGTQLCQDGTCRPWQRLFGCNNERRSAI